MAQHNVPAQLTNCIESLYKQNMILEVSEQGVIILFKDHSNFHCHKQYVQKKVCNGDLLIDVYKVKNMCIVLVRVKLKFVVFTHHPLQKWSSKESGVVVKPAVCINQKFVRYISS